MKTATIAVKVSDLKEFKGLIGALGESLRQYEALPTDVLESLPGEFRAACAELRSAAEKLAAAGRTAQ